jgi:hypothetical protein
MSSFFNLLATGARSLSFEKRSTVLEFSDKPLLLPLRKPRKPRTPAEIMQSAWEDVGNRMWEAVGEVEKEYGRKI